MYRKVISLLVSSVLLLSPVTYVLAGTVTTQVAMPISAEKSIDESNVKISKDNAKNIALKSLKDLLEAEIDEKKFENRIELRQNYGIKQDYGINQEYVWDIGYNYYDDLKSMNYTVVINANTGKVIQVQNYEYLNNGEQTAIFKVSEEEAKTIADSFLKKVNPKEYSSLKLMNNPYRGYYEIGAYQTNYEFRYIRMVNGIEFESNAITVSVNGSTGKVSGYSYNWDEDINLPTIEAIITKEKAEELLKQGTGLTLRYISHRNKYNYNEKVNEIKLIYTPEFPNGPFIDALDGKPLNNYNSRMEQLSVKDISVDQKDKIYKSAKNSQPADKEIDNNRASQVIKEYLKEFLGSEYEIESLRYTEGTNDWMANGRKSWTAQFYKKNSDGIRDFRSNGQIAIDALTEEIVGLYSSHNYEEETGNLEPKITWDQAYEKAIEYIAKYCPQRIKEISTEQKHLKNSYYINGKDMGERYYNFNFSRIVNGIPYQDNQIMINFDAATGSMMEYRYIWDDTVKFPNPQEVISKTEIEKIYYNQMDTNLTYNLFNKSKDEATPEMEAKLVYIMKPIEYTLYMPYGYIDAITGRFVDYSGDELKGYENSFKKQIQGHWAEKELSILAYHGIIDTKEFSLEKEMTRMDAVKMLVNAKGYRPNMIKDMEALNFSNVIKDSDEYRYLQLAVRYGVVKNLDGEFSGADNITREQMTEMITNLLGYNKLAKAKNIFAVSFTDAGEISENMYGAIAIGTGLDIFTSDEGKFRPKDKVKFVEFAVAIYKALNSIRDLEK